jgi:hypothetical protein
MQSEYALTLILNLTLALRQLIVIIMRYIIIGDDLQI